MAQLRICVSYAYTDSAFTMMLVNALRAAGADVWYAKHPHETPQLLETTVHEMKTRPVFLSVLSPSALRSHMVRRVGRAALAYSQERPYRLSIAVAARPLIGVTPRILHYVQQALSIETPDDQPYPSQQLIERVLSVLGLASTSLPALPDAFDSMISDLSADELILYGQICIEQHALDAAIAALKQATAQASSHRQAYAWAYLGLAYATAHQSELAIDAFERAQDFGLTRAWIWSNKSSMLGNVGEYEAALAAAEAAIALEPRYDYPWLNKGSALLALGRAEEALDAFDQGLRFTKHYKVRGWLCKARAFAYLSRFDEALAATDQAIALDSKNTTVLREKCRILSRLDRIQDALDVYDELLLSDPHNIAAWLGKADILYDADRYEEALVACEQALSIDPHDAHAWNSKGNALSGLYQHEEALAAYQRALQLDPDNGWYAGNIRVVLTLLERASEYDTVINQAKAVGTENTQ